MKITAYNPKIDQLIDACASEVAESLRTSGELKEKVMAEYRARAKAILLDVDIEYYNGIEKLATGKGAISDVISGKIPEGRPYAKIYSKNRIVSGAGINAQAAFSAETALYEDDFETYDGGGKSLGLSKMDEVLRADPLMAILSDMQSKSVDFSGFGWYRRNQYFKQFPEERERYERSKNPEKYAKKQAIAEAKRLEDEKKRAKAEEKRLESERKKAVENARKKGKAESEKAKKEYNLRQKERAEYKKHTRSVITSHLERLQDASKTHPNKMERKIAKENYGHLNSEIAIQHRENQELMELAQKKQEAWVELLKTKFLADEGLLKEGSKEAQKHAEAESAYLASVTALENRKNELIDDILLSAKPREMWGNYNSKAVRKAMLRVDQIQKLDFSYFVLDTVEDMQALSQYPKEIVGSEDVVDDLKIIAESHLEESGFPTKIEFVKNLKGNVLFTHGLDHPELDPQLKELIEKREKELRKREDRLRRQNGETVIPQRESVDLSKDLHKASERGVKPIEESPQKEQIVAVEKDEEIGDND